MLGSSFFPLLFLVFSNYSLYTHRSKQNLLSPHTQLKSNSTDEKSYLLVYCVHANTLDQCLKCVFNLRLNTWRSEKASRHSIENVTLRRRKPLWLRCCKSVIGICLPRLITKCKRLLRKWFKSLKFLNPYLSPLSRQPLCHFKHREKPYVLLYLGDCASQRCRQPPHISLLLSSLGTQ